MPQLKDALGLEGATIEELITEQPDRADAEYLKRVNKGLVSAVSEADTGDVIGHDDVWAQLNSELGLAPDAN